VCVCVYSDQNATLYRCHKRRRLLCIVKYYYVFFFLFKSKYKISRILNICSILNTICVKYHILLYYACCFQSQQLLTLGDSVRHNMTHRRCYLVITCEYQYILCSIMVNDNNCLGTS